MKDARIKESKIMADAIRTDNLREPKLADAQRREIADGYFANTQPAEAHDLYATGDADAPEQIKDRNGDVALRLCRRCGRGEVELADAPCAPEAESTEAQIADLAHELWAAAQTGPGEGIADAVARISQRLRAAFEAKE